VDESAVVAGEHPSVWVAEPSAMIALEARGYSLGEILGAPGNTNDVLAESAIYKSLYDILRGDLVLLGNRPGVLEPNAPNRTFAASWLVDRDARFELVGFVPRLDRAFVEPGTCGELRLVYRLALTRARRPTTRLPMTLSVLMVPRGDAAACSTLAKSLVALPARGSERISAIAELLRAHRNDTMRIEVNLQNLHGSATPRDGEDHAEYSMRSLDVTKWGVVERPLLNTPREDLTADQRRRLGAYIHEHFVDVDRGTLVVPSEFLATSVTSVSPRGLARTRNRPFSSLFGEEADALFADLPYASAKIARSPHALLRRLDQSTCQGCHQTRALAGFHLLGEERSPRTFNALAVGHSAQVSQELPWRDAFTASMARGETYDVPRPLADRGAEGAGESGARCGLGDPGFAAYGCGLGLTCEDDRHDDFGECAPADGNHEGDACERANVESHIGANGDHLSPLPREPCIVDGREVQRDACILNENGFPGGMCSGRCDAIGEMPSRAGVVCMDVPRAGYEETCFQKNEPIEPCIAARADRLRMRACDASHPCRDDYACARVPGLPDTRGACIPPYFVFQARVDGPLLDR